MVKQNYVTITPAVLLVAGVLLFGCSKRTTEPTEEIINSVPVTITHVSYEPLAEYLELNANSIFQKKNAIRSSLTGIVLSVAVMPGDKVAKGQKLFTLVSKEASVLLGKTIQNDTSLCFNGQFIIKAQQNGIINSITHQQGDYVQEGDELAIVVEPTSLVFNIQAPFEITNYIHLGENCDIILPTQKSFRGKIVSSLPSMDIQAQTLALVVKPLTNEMLPENLLARVKIVKSFKKNAFTLPKEAVLTNETQTLFWVMKLVNDTLAVKTMISKGIETDNKIEILKPRFSSADRILVTGNFGLEDSMKVSITVK